MTVKFAKNDKRDDVTTAVTSTVIAFNQIDGKQKKYDQPSQNDDRPTLKFGRFVFPLTTIMTSVPRKIHLNDSEITRLLSQN